VLPLLFFSLCKPFTIDCGGATFCVFSLAAAAEGSGILTGGEHSNPVLGRPVHNSLDVDTYYT